MTRDATPERIAVPRELVAQCVVWFQLLADCGMIAAFENGERTPNAKSMDELAAQFSTLLADTAPSETGADDPVKPIKVSYERVLQYRKALEQCVRVAKMWHGDDAFDLYFNHSPEMKLIRDALGKMPEEA